MVKLPPGEVHPALPAIDHVPDIEAPVSVVELVVTVAVPVTVPLRVRVLPLAVIAYVMVPVTVSFDWTTKTTDPVGIAGETVVKHVP
jgi:hypothetical protein